MARQKSQLPVNQIFERVSLSEVMTGVTLTSTVWFLDLYIQFMGDKHHMLVVHSKNTLNYVGGPSDFTKYCFLLP